MCNAVSGITKSDGTVYMPDPSTWYHSHTSIAQLHGIPDGMLGDGYARWELTPNDGNYQSDPDTWAFTLDEERKPAWWEEDAAAFEDKARSAVKRYMAKAGHLAPGAVVVAGNGGTATAGNRGTATAGNGGTATAGNGGTATAGDYGTATAGDYGAATAGHGGAATAGDYGAATAGDHGTLCIKWWDGARYRIAVGYVGENGIKPNVAYRLNATGSFVEAAKAGGAA